MVFHPAGVPTPIVPEGGLKQEVTGEAVSPIAVLPVTTRDNVSHHMWEHPLLHWFLKPLSLGIMRVKVTDVTDQLVFISFHQRQDSSVQGHRGLFWLIKNYYSAASRSI